ncbi:hypothetical protein ACFU5O_35560 [Streptomyces sp. NPDC057445]|uniref:hypothetical protein n=1 Tax=Streptomyces sp. NPDC057445 TaxID=3346136 RepID=UPI00368B5816
MSHWVITMQTVSTSGCHIRTVAEFDGSREAAERALRHIAQVHRPELLVRERRRRIHRQTDGAYHVHINGIMGSFDLIFRAAELVWDSEWPKSAHGPGLWAGPGPQDAVPPIGG